MSISKVIERLGRTHGDIGIAPGSIAAWCYEVIEQNGVYESLQHFSTKVPVKGGTAELPCNLYRLETVGSCDRCNNVKYRQVDGRIHLHNLQPSHVHISGTVVAADEQGYPMVDDIMVDACYWYCVWKSLEHGYFNGEVDASRYDRAEMNYYRHVSAAKGSLRYTTRDDIQAIANVLRSFALPKR